MYLCILSNITHFTSQLFVSGLNRKTDSTGSAVIWIFIRFNQVYLFKTCTFTNFRGKDLLTGPWYKIKI